MLCSYFREGRIKGDDSVVLESLLIFGGFSGIVGMGCIYLEL